MIISHLALVRWFGLHQLAIDIGQGWSAILTVRCTTAIVYLLLICFTTANAFTGVTTTGSGSIRNLRHLLISDLIEIDLTGVGRYVVIIFRRGAHFVLCQRLVIICGSLIFNCGIFLRRYFITHCEEFLVLHLLDI